MLKKSLALLLTAAALFSLCACGSSSAPAASDSDFAPASAASDSDLSTVQEATDQAEPAETTVTDLVGREVTVTPGSYTRVVCIGAGALRMYCYVGDPALLCGVEDIDNESLSDRPKMFDAVARPYMLAYGAVFAALPSCGVGGPNAQTAEAEKILSCAPDIVISEYEDAEKAEALQAQLGVPVITLRTGPNGIFDDAFGESMALLGSVFAAEDKASALTDFVAAQLAELGSRTADIPPEQRPGVYICGLGNWGTTNHLYTAQTYKTFDCANVRNVVTDLGKAGVQAIEAEKFVALGEDMDMLIIDAAAVKNIQPLFAEDPTMFDSCKAWRDGEVYLQMAYNAYYTNYEISLINAWFIAKTVYPDSFADIDLTAKTDEITEQFLGKALSEEIFACPASFGGYQKIDTATFFG